ncbi:uncharacterized protein LOC123539055 [Mercenaria mercenaria]|uniref:uncharacterized protein LOC123539055 n=1 Tax=Mercenaria mercenaria TaxID=6596 RepID=UPI00234FAD9B|nr:uncharacterized protein LOC123539055 [Mercenaria mercenaria]
MASGGNSLEQGSDTIFQFHCSQCVKDGKNSESVKFCEECYDYLCQTCLNTHNRWVALRRHKLLTMDEIRGKIDKPTTFVRKNCAVHNDTCVELYCAEHDAVLCKECCEISTHESCSAEYLPKVAMNCNEELRSLRFKANTIKRLCENVENKRLKDIARLNEQSDKSKSEIDNFAKNLVFSLNKSVDSLRKKVDNKNAGHIDTINEDITILQEAKAYLANHSQSDDENKMQLFLNMQDAKSVVPKYQSVIQEIEKRAGKETIAIRFKSSTKASLTHYKDIAVFKDEEDPLYSDGDLYASTIKDFCQMTDGTIIATDITNNKVKLLDSLYRLKDSIKVSTSPWGVCQIADSQIAVSCEKKIQFFNLHRKSKFRSDILMNDKCRGMTYCGGKLFVCCEGFDLGEGSSRILVFDRSGEQIQDINHKGIIGRPLSLAKSEDEQKIFVADSNKGIVILNINGQLIDAIRHPQLKIAAGVCVGKSGEVYTFDYSSGELFKLELHKALVKIDKLDVKLKCRNIVLFDRTRDRIISQSDNKASIEFVNVL